MTDPNTKNNWDEDINTQETPDVRAKISAAEDEVFLRDIFGVYLPNVPLAPELAATIAHRIVTVIDTTRTHIDRAGLERVLNQNIGQALMRATRQNRRTPTAGPLLDAQRMRNVRAVSEAIRESVPSVAMTEVLRYGLPSFVPEDRNLSQHIVSLGPVTLRLSDRNDPRAAPTDTNCRVEIDTRHVFWRQKYAFTRPVTTPPNPGVDTLRAELVRALVTEKKTFATLGIRILNDATRTPIPENAIVEDDTSIDALLAGEARGIDLTKRYEDITYIDPLHPNITIRVNTANLIRYCDRTGFLVASYENPSFLRDLFTVDADARNFLMIDPPNSVVTDWLPLAQAVFDQLRPGASGPLAINTMNLRNIQSQIGEQHYFHNALREGSDNQMAAAFASSILMKYKDIRDTLSLGNDTQVNTDLAQERRRKDLLAAMKAAEGISFAPLFDWQTARTTRSTFGVQTSLIPAGGTMDLGGQTYTILPGASASERNAAMQWANERLKEANKIIADASQLSNAMIRICDSIRAIRPGSTTPDIFNYFNLIGTRLVPRRTRFSNSLNIASLMDQIRNDSDLALKTEEDHKKKIDELKATLEKMKKGEIPKGDKAQFLVIKKYLIQYQGMTDDEASRGANVIRGRSQLDTEMNESLRYVSDSLHKPFEEDEIAHEDDDTITFGPQRDRERIRNVARAALIPLNADRRPAWESARNYKDLMGAYFALRQMRDGTGVPWMMRLSGSASVRREMHEITRAILQNHLKAMLQDFGSGMNITDDEQQLILKDPKKPEHNDLLLQMLSGGVPPQHQPTVDKILQSADKRTFRYRRAAGNALFGENWGAIRGEKLGVSGKNLLYGNKNWSAWGAMKGTYNFGEKTIKSAWAKKAPIAKIAALTMLGGPLGLAVGIGFFGKEFSKSKAASSGASSHH